MEHSGTHLRGNTAAPHTVGYRSPLPDDAVHAAALADIRRFPVGSSVIRIISRANVADGAPSEHDVYEDDLGFVFRCDPRHGRVVQVDRREDRYTKTRPVGAEARIAVAELRARAMALATERSASFAADRSAFHPMEGHRDRELYVFRWEDCRGALSDCDEPPYIEVGMYADGSLARFADALSAQA